MSRNTLRLVIVSSAAFAAVFLATLVARSQQAPADVPDAVRPLAQWLGLDPETAAEIHRHDPEFPRELDELRTRLEAARAALAALFDDPGSTDEAIRRQVEATIAAHDVLERRVTDYLLTVRNHLTPQQQRRLFDLCAEKVRQGGQHRWRHGWGGQGLGGGAGRGPGGRGRGAGGGGHGGNNGGGDSER